MKCILLFIIVCAVMMKPYPGRKKELEMYHRKFIAHRGLHDGNKTVAENSIEAFQRAVDRGFPIELDVVITQDKVPVVFHDYDLLRAAGVDKKVSDLTLDEINSYRMFRLVQGIPTLKEVLELVDGQVPLLIEIKGEDEPIDLTAAVALDLEEYTGKYAVQSFNPMIIKWYKENKPHILRGLLSTDYLREKVGQPFFTRLLLELKWMNFFTRPDFLSYHRKYKSNLIFLILKHVYKMPTAGWTIGSKEQWEEDKDIFDYYIFEGFDPEEVIL